MTRAMSWEGRPRSAARCRTTPRARSGPRSCCAFRSKNSTIRPRSTAGCCAARWLIWRWSSKRCRLRTRARKRRSDARALLAGSNPSRSLGSRTTRSRIRASTRFLSANVLGSVALRRAEGSVENAVAHRLSGSVAHQAVSRPARGAVFGYAPHRQLDIGRATLDRVGKGMCQNLQVSARRPGILVEDVCAVRGARCVARLEHEGERVWRLRARARDEFERGSADGAIFSDRRAFYGYRAAARGRRIGERPREVPCESVEIAVVHRTLEPGTRGTGICGTRGTGICAPRICATRICATRICSTRAPLNRGARPTFRAISDSRTCPADSRRGARFNISHTASFGVIAGPADRLKTGRTAEEPWTARCRLRRATAGPHWRERQTPPTNKHSSYRHDEASSNFDAEPKTAETENELPPPQQASYQSPVTAMQFRPSSKGRDHLG